MVQVYSIWCLARHVSVSSVPSETHLTSKNRGAMIRSNHIVALGLVIAACLAVAQAAPSSDLSRWFAGMPEGAKTASDDGRDRYEVSCLTPTVYKNCKEFGTAGAGNQITASQTNLFLQ